MAPLVLQSTSSLFATIDATSFLAELTRPIACAPPHPPRVERSSARQCSLAWKMFPLSLMLGVGD